MGRHWKVVMKKVGMFLFFLLALPILFFPVVCIGLPMLVVSKLCGIKPYICHKCEHYSSVGDDGLGWALGCSLETKPVDGKPAYIGDEKCNKFKKKGFFDYLLFELFG